MKKKNIFKLFILFGLIISIQAKSNTPSSDKKIDSLILPSEKFQPKTGLNIAPFPEFMIDPFVGLYIGINTTIFDYGDGSKYPNYNQLLNINAAWGTKGKTNLSVRYKRYGKRIFSVKASLTKNNLFPFYGLNGYQTYYNKEYHTTNADNYITTAFYNYRQEKTQFDFYFQDKFPSILLDWQIGLSLNYYNLSRVDFDVLNKNNGSEDLVIDNPTLYDRYIGWNLIEQSERNGGWSNSVRFALIHDSRSSITNPMKGIWSQIILRYTPEFLGNNNSAIQLTATHQHYLTLIEKRVSFAYRLRYDGAFGALAFYTKQVMADGIEGYGGASGVVGEGFGTIWGIHQNRVVAKQMALANFEVRAKLFWFRMFNQNWHLSAVPLFHTGIILEPYTLDLSQVSIEDKELFFRNSHKEFYSSIGLGGKLVMNDNIVIGLDWAHALNKEAGNNALYIGFGYSF
jgi:hypothetical protein